MKLSTNWLLVSLFSGFAVVSAWAATPLREATLRNAALKAGIAPVENLLPKFSAAASRAGEQLFESKLLSLNNETSCQTCHLDRFASADGLPNAIGTGGHGEGIERLHGGGDIVPRNTLPLWGRGSEGFNMLFWDGKVDGTGDYLLSQFGDFPPSKDPLVTAVHLPIVELREMVSDGNDARHLISESISSAESIYQEVVSRLRQDDEIAGLLSDAFNIDRDSIKIGHVAESIAAFIRDRFRLRETNFHRFVFENGKLSDNEIAGGLLFYGKGQCAACHNGAFFSDLSFHSIPFGQLGFGKNGFGVDYGRFNVTLDPTDLYKFRTPPLINVAQTGPYSHSGFAADLTTAIRAHIDPLSALDVAKLTEEQRFEFYAKLKIWSLDGFEGVVLNEREIALIEIFLRTLTMDEPSEYDHSVIKRPITARQ